MDPDTHAASEDLFGVRGQHTAATGVPDLIIDGVPYRGKLLFSDLAWCPRHGNYYSGAPRCPICEATGE